MTTGNDIIEHKFLGAFKRTGIRRSPRIGDYYQCEQSPGIGLCTQNGGRNKEILEPLSKTVKVKCKVVA